MSGPKVRAAYRTGTSSYFSCSSRPKIPWPRDRASNLSPEREGGLMEPYYKPQQVYTTAILMQSSAQHRADSKKFCSSTKLLECHLHRV